MEGSGRVASKNLFRSLNRNISGSGGAGGSGGGCGGRCDNISSARQTSGLGYEGSSEDTQQNLINVSYDRRRSRSWQRHAQQLERSGPWKKGLSPIYRGKRWRRRLMKKKVRSASTINAPPCSPADTSTNSNHSINVKLPDQEQQHNLAPIPLSGLVEKQAQQQQQKQHDRRSTVGSFNEIKSDSIVKTCVTNDDIKLTFQVQLAHGSPTGIITGFNNIVQLYQAIANCYDEISMDDILFCTVNTHRISMDALLCSNININDFIFAHIAGQKKEVTLTKTELALGLTITDNGAGKAFIKRIVPGTLASKAKPALEVGDFIEKINGESMIGRKHFDVARRLRTLPIGSTFTIRLIAPKKTGFNFIASYNMPKRIKSIFGANETIRFKADGTTIVQSDINNFDFPTELYFDLWGAVDDYRNGRLGKVEVPMEKTANHGKLLPDEQKL
ncbi:unnamed protein product [Acanthocheilonema viteae]|uniref:PDZ domain-containing protein n=1 Tax=Acanthocheilonema viteae TaxID=6277 RepID=A0A498SNF1_ACAVI|nr:unnamed protein product [Acanthocheilonema viteae]